MRPSITLGRAGAIFAVVGVGALTFAMSALAHTTISTSWNRATGFKPPSSLEQEWGQVITVPVGETQLTSFTLQGGATAGSATIQVYAWSGTQATGSALFTSSTTFSGINFSAAVTPDVAVTPGAQYVVFEDVSGVSSQLGHGNTSDSYSGGGAFYHDGPPTGSAWTNTGSPFAFSAVFDSPAPASVARGAYCASSPVLRQDGTTGIFLDLTDGQPASDPSYAGAVRAWYGQRYGLTCDNLPGLGYTDAGYKVDGAGTHTANPAWDVYEYFTKS